MTYDYKSLSLLSFVNRKYYRLKKSLVESNCPDKGKKWAEVGNWFMFCDNYV